ncbi:hypothetical protein MIT9_P2147 [Methylomarinovum caldicuralii]|uniref:TonB-dependent receptor n=1 Tax=Methylomarinovum caldicuralii TaxID=438856 RepID=A0AAU9CLL1_9GAMM|nr:hypothetical protein MIT9_P2147 [Methylomarinovum caldicuralii]
MISAVNGKPLAAAEVYISGLNQPVVTDRQGRFQVKVPAGTYSLSASAPGYNLMVKEGIRVAGEKPLQVTLKLTPAGIEMPPFVVVEPHLAGSVASAISEERVSSGVTDILGAEQISRAGDSNVAAALKRVAGVTIVRGKFPYIRGLGERYANILINGISMPSPDPTRRVVPLDFFPSAMLDSIQVQKTHDAPLPGEFSGGIINLRTRSTPDEFLFRLSGKISYIDGTTFEKGLRYQGGDYDWIGVDDGTRALPKSLENALGGLSGSTKLRPKTRFAKGGFTQEEFERFGEDLSDVWNVKRDTLPPNGRISAALGDKLHWRDFSFGYYAFARWNQNWRTFHEIRRKFVPVRNGQELQLAEDMKVFRTVREVNTNAYLNVESTWREKHKLFGRVMLLRQSTDFTRIREGFSNTEGAGLRRVRLWYRENELFNWQAGTDQTFAFLNDLNLKFLYSHAVASRYAPKERRYRYDQNLNKGGVFEFSNKTDNNQIIYSDLDDQEDSWRIDLTLPYHFFDDRLKGSLASGYWSTQRERNSNIRRFRYAGNVSPDLLAQPLEDILTPENIGPGRFTLTEVTRSTDNYSASQDLQAYYVKLDSTFFDLLRLTGGVRIEENQQTVTTFELFAPDNQPIVSTLDSRDAIPSVTLTWLISEDQQLRLAWSKTLSRPDFRELSPAPFTDPNTLQETVGNPDLQQAEIMNYDARWEYYFSPKENLTLAFFHKEITNPIEKVLLAGPADLAQLQNTGDATLTGFEIEFRKNLDFIHPWFENFFFSGNYTFAKSEVTLLPENLQVLTTPKRPLQGASKHILNARLGYDNEDLGTQATLLYNFPSRRIAQVGQLGAPDIYEEPFHQLDFIVKQKWNRHWSTQVRLRNLLDSTVRFTQGPKTVRAFRRGREFALVINFQF